MSEHRTRHITRRPLTTVALLAAAAAATLGCLGLASRSAGAANLGSLQSQLSATSSRQASLSASLAALATQIGALTTQIGLVQSRQAAVRASLAADSQRLQAVRAAGTRERRRLVVLRRLLTRARSILSAQLVSRYESTPPSLISVVLDAHGFSQLLDQLQFLGDAEHAQQTAIRVTSAAKHAAAAETARLAVLARTDARITATTALQADALAGMNTLLVSREAALADARAAQRTALANAQARGAGLREAIARVQAERAAAARAAALRAQQLRAQAQASASAASLGPAGGWAIPYPIVLCESGGQNLPPNSAGASGYYQIIPGTWRLFGGTGPAAYLAPKAEQDAVAARIWNGGAGASDWACAAMLSQG